MWHSTAPSIEETFDPCAARQIFTTPTADVDNDGVYDVVNYLKSFKPGGGTDYDLALSSRFLTLGTMTDDLTGNANIFFLSDGEPNDTNYGPIVASLRQQYGANLRAFGVGSGATSAPLQIIDPNAAIFTTTDELLGAFGSLTGDQQPEEGLAGKRVYLDLNTNGVYDSATEPSTLTGATVITNSRIYQRRPWRRLCQRPISRKPLQRRRIFIRNSICLSCTARTASISVRWKQDPRLRQRSRRQAA